jgi:DNA modification methylase
VILQGDCREVLRTLPAESVQCCVTSPPYWGLRDYGHPSQLGLEPTPEEYVANMVDVFREVRRVLRPDGTLWLNLGDSYATQPGKGSNVPQTKWGSNSYPESAAHRSRGFDGLKPKDLVGIPWRVAFALQADGWWLRSDIIWSKGNPMPESVTDRPTKAHEYLFLLTKSERYFYDADAIKEDAAPESEERYKYAFGGAKSEALVDANKDGIGQRTRPVGEREYTGKRNARSVWTITTKPFPEAHFATFPPEIPMRCILAGSRPGDTVLDPFGGSGTTGLVAQELGRHWIACELNPEYIAIAERRTAQNTLWLDGAA